MIIIEPLEQRIAPAVMVVSNTNDAGPGSLRQAILDANANSGSDFISFSLTAAVVHTISLKTALPPILDSLGIDAGDLLRDGLPSIEIDGREVQEAANGLELRGGEDTFGSIRGLSIFGFKGHGISSDGTSLNVSSCFIGVNATGSAAIGNAGDGLHFVGRQPGSSPATTSSVGDCVISGNGEDGIDLLLLDDQFFHIMRSKVGTDYNGSYDLGNGGNGVRIAGEALSPVSVSECLISGNDRYGVDVSGASFGMSRSFVGVDVKGSKAVGNELGGLLFTGNVRQCAIDGSPTLDGFQTVISGNGGHGIELRDAGLEYVQLWGVLVGVSKDSKTAIPNRGDGLLIDGIGEMERGVSIGVGSIFSGNERHGIEVLDSTKGSLTGALIGVGGDGVTPVPNGGDGIYIHGNATRYDVGSNVISGNSGAGVRVSESAGQVGMYGNWIGMDRLGHISLPNSSGVVIDTTGSDFRIGSSVLGSYSEPNKIGGNIGNGIQVVQAGALTIADNDIGFGLHGQVLPNGGHGISVSSTPNALIRDNRIGGNALDGIYLAAGCEGAQIARNFVGGVPGEVGAEVFIFPNGRNGIHVAYSDNVTIGGVLFSPAGNAVTGNLGVGIYVENVAHVSIKHNGAGQYTGGPVTPGNQGAGILLENVTDAVVSGNWMPGNEGPGLHIVSSSQIIAEANRIGVAYEGKAVGNGGPGILLENTSGADLGGANYNEENQIGFNSGGGIKIVGGSNNTVRNLAIFGNGVAGIHLVGTNQTVIDRNLIGVPPLLPLTGNQGPGILLDDSSGTMIGNDDPSRNNVIADSHGGGIVVKGGSGNTFRNIEFYASEGLEIDLGGDGPTPNDPLDLDEGANGLQNAPNLAGAFKSNVGLATLQGTMQSAPNSTYRIEFYSAYGIGKVSKRIGSVDVLTNSNGIAPFNYEASYGIASHVTAIATNLETGDSSEFSAYVEVLPPPELPPPASSLQISPDRRLATWIDVDGDLVTLKVSRPVLDPDDFVFRAEGSLCGERLLRLDLKGAEGHPRGAALNLAIEAEPRNVDSVRLGDSAVEVEIIDGEKRSFGKISIDGDLGGLTATKLGSFKAHSVGKAAFANLAVTTATEISVSGRIGSLTVLGDIQRTNIAAENIGTVRVGGDFIGSSLTADVRLSSFRSNDVRGSEMEGSGTIDAGVIGSVHLSGSLVGGVAAGSGLISADRIGSVLIQGVIFGGEGGGSGIKAVGRIGPVKVGGTIVGYDVAHPVVIEAVGAFDRSPYALAKLSVHGDVRNTHVFAGSPSHAGESLGPIEVGGGWEASIAAASIDPGGDHLFGTADDRLGGTAAGDPVVRSIARIARITVGGVIGTEETGDNFGFFAQRVGPMKLHGVMTQKGLLPGTDDVELLEIAARQA